MTTGSYGQLRRRMRAIAAACLCLAAAAPRAALPDDVAAAAAVIYLGPAGSDAADGASPGTALAGLQAAISLAERKFGEGYRDVTVRVLPGRYAGQRARTAGPGAGRRLAILAEDGNDAPVFDGAGRGGTWLSVPGRVGQPTNLLVAGLTITHYATAITLNGSRDNLDDVVSQVEIRDNVFDAIGQDDAQAKPSTAVIRLVNGDDNRIVGNRFVRFRNVRDCSLLHALYVAHGSTGNLIEGNVFQDGCGDAIRFRDMSSHNVVRNNSFEDAWQSAPISDWYCDASTRTDCTKATSECPSVDNRLVANRMVVRKVADKGLTAEFGPPDTKLCPVDAGSRRFLQQ